ncbi:epoxyqueuosine reductase QueH, partial [Rhodovulum adriaticum]|uniref:epoxyqueuosine reductase QueH n=1 Tax=Rhodovulum adriaticum TaxID=35804 RepID=UPI001903D805
VNKVHNINLIKTPYDPKEYFSAVKGHEMDKEGGERCHICYELRLDMAAQYALKHGYDYFTTTLSISPYKNAQVINAIGEKLEKKYDVSYLYADFKKKNGFQRSIELCNQFDIYRQDYCGCVFSLKEAKDRRKAKEEREKKLQELELDLKEDLKGVNAE